MKAQPAKTALGIELMKAVTGAKKPNTPTIKAATNVIQTEPILLKPIVALLSPQLVLGSPPTAAPTAAAT